MKERLESTAEKYEGMKELITLGREKGYLLYDEVNSVLPDHITSSKDLDSIFTLFGDAGIEVIDSEKVPEAGEQKTLSQEPEEERERKPDSAAESLEKTNDPVRMYLREMGTVPLLTWPGEIEIAKRIERGKTSVLEVLSRSPIVVWRIAEYGDQLRKNTLRIKSLVKFSEDEVTDEILTKRRRLVLRRVNQITALEKEAVKVRKRLRRAKKGGKTYKKLLSQLARYQIPMARIILDLELTSEVLQGFVSVVESNVDRIVTLERETKQLKKLKVSSLKLDEAKKVKLRLRVIDKEMKEIEDKVLVSPAGLKRTLAAIKQGELEAEIAKKELVEANLRLVVSITKKYFNRGLQFLDLIQEGNIGLMKAVDKFEYQRGYKVFHLCYLVDSSGHHTGHC